MIKSYDLIMVLYHNRASSRTDTRKKVVSNLSAKLVELTVTVVTFWVTGMGLHG